MSLARTLALGGMIYAFFLLGFPDWKGPLHHVLHTAVVCGGALGTSYFLHALRVSSLVVTVIYELGFGLALFLYFFYGFPQRSGKTPVELLASGHRPDRAAARKGLERLKIDENSPAGRLMAGLFPEGR